APRARLPGPGAGDALVCAGAAVDAVLPGRGRRPGGARRDPRAGAGGGRPARPPGARRRRPGRPELADLTAPPPEPTGPSPPTRPPGRHADRPVSRSA